MLNFLNGKGWWVFPLAVLLLTLSSYPTFNWFDYTTMVLMVILVLFKLITNFQKNKVIKTDTIEEDTNSG